MEFNQLIALQRTVSSLRLNLVKPYLSFLLREINVLKEQGHETEDAHSAMSNLVELYDQIIQLDETKQMWKPSMDCEYVHIVTGDSFGGSIKHAIREKGLENKQKVIVLQENYAIGPLLKLNTEEGRAHRKQWFQDNMSEAFEAYSEFEEEYTALTAEIDRIPEHASICIWIGDNACEQLGMRHALYMLQNKSNKVSLHDAASLIKYYTPEVTYLYSGEIPIRFIKQILQQVDYSRTLTDDMRARFIKEWKKQMRLEGTLRLWHYYKLNNVSEDYYDSYILEKLESLRPPEQADQFLKSARLIGEVMGYCDQYIGDSFFEYRIRELIYAGILEIKGVPAGMRYYSVRKKKNDENKISSI